MIPKLQTTSYRQYGHWRAPVNIHPRMQSWWYTWPQGRTRKSLTSSNSAVHITHVSKSPHLSSHNGINRNMSTMLMVRLHRKCLWRSMLRLRHLWRSMLRLRRLWRSVVVCLLAATTTIMDANTNKENENSNRTIKVVQPWWCLHRLWPVTSLWNLRLNMKRQNQRQTHLNIRIVQSKSVKCVDLAKIKKV